MTIETQTSLRERAIAALELRRAQEAEAAAERDRRDAEREAERYETFRRTFGAILEEHGFAGCEIVDHHAEVEGVRLAMRYPHHGGPTLAALAPCRDCGYDSPEWTYVRNLADFGAVLVEWLPAHAEYECDRCRDRAFYAAQRREDETREAERVARAQEWAAREAERAAAPPPTAEEQLLSALRRFVVALHDGED